MDKKARESRGFSGDGYARLQVEESVRRDGNRCGRRGFFCPRCVRKVHREFHYTTFGVSWINDAFYGGKKEYGGILFVT